MSSSFQYSCFSFCGVLSVSRRPSACLPREHWIAVLGVWIVASAAWSVAPGQTVRYAVPFFGLRCSWAYMWLCALSLYGQIRLLALCLGISAILSLIFGIAFPDASRFRRMVNGKASFFIKMPSVT